jgi:RHS repeat-associated protein
MESSLSLVANSNNQITTFSYDASGNTLNDTHNSYTWNAESEIQTAAGVTYTYDGDGDRVQKSSGKIYWYGAGSEILDESDSSGNITDEYVYFGGRRVAHRVVSGNSIYYYGEDFLGTSRQIFTSASALCYDADFYPFGGERAYTTTCTPTYKFEGKERDSETSNDDFGARYYSSSFGRWTSPDWSAIPEPVPYANLTNPQTLNLYAMVSDNAETFADLDGHCPACAEEATEAVEPVVEPILAAAEENSPMLQKVADALSADFASVDNAVTNASNTGGKWIVAGLAAGLSALKGDKAPAAKPDNAKGEEKTAEPEAQAASGGKGTIYKVPGSATRSGKPYIGRHNKPNPAKTRRSKDGRDRTKAKVVDTYDANDVQEGKVKEQKHIDDNGGVLNLDNQRNEIKKKQDAPR